MIPLYIQSTDGGTQGLPTKNPIFYMQKSIGKPNSDEYDVIVINVVDSFVAQSYVGMEPPIDAHLSNWERVVSDVEVVNVVPNYDQQVDPYPDRSGAIAGKPSKTHTSIALQGFVNADSLNYAQGYAKQLNRVFDPTLNYLMGSSTFDDTQAVIWQPPYNVGFGVLAWFDPSSKDDWRVVNDWVDMNTDPFSVEEFARLNRFMFVRSEAKPVEGTNKFGDFADKFVIRLIATDPRIYEFIAPEDWWAAGETQQLFIDRSANGILLTGDNGSSPSITSDEVFIVPDFPWREGPGWREVTSGSMLLYHSNTGSPTGLGDSADVHSGWDRTDGISGVGYDLFKTAADSSINGHDNWEVVNAAACFAFQAGYTIQLSDELLLAKVRGGGTFKGQHRATSRNGVGINEGAQDNYVAMGMRVYRPSTGEFFNLMDVQRVSSTKNQTVSPYSQNRSIAGSFSGYSGALSTDHLVVDYGVDHVGPTSGGTGAGVIFTSTSATNLPEDNTTETANNSWLRII